MIFKVVFLSFVLFSLRGMYSCENSSKGDLGKLPEVISDLSESEYCDIESHTRHDNNGSIIELNLGCDLVDKHSYGRFLLNLFERLSEGSIFFDVYSIKNTSGKEVLSLSSNKVKLVLEKKKSFEKTIELLNSKKVGDLFGRIEKRLLEDNDSTIFYNLRDKYNLHGVVFIGFQIGEMKFEDIDEPFELITFKGRDESLTELTITLSMDENNDKIYGVEF